MAKVVPAIIPHTKLQLEEEIQKVASFAQVIQIDISDGVFIPTKTWPYNERDKDFFHKLTTEEEGWPKWQDLEYEIHLMVQKPEATVLEWIRTGATAIVAHIEATEDFQKVIDICRESSVSVGVALKPSTDISRLNPFIAEIDFIQVMGSNLLGKHGVELEAEAIEKIKELRKLYPEKEIAIDIGVNLETKETLIEAGATKLISGGAILEASNPEEIFLELSA